MDKNYWIAQIPKSCLVAAACPQ